MSRGTATALIAGVIVIVATVALELLSGHGAHAEFWWHRTPGFDALYGFIGCVVIVLASKALGKRWIQRDEDYYERRRR